MANNLTNAGETLALNFLMGGAAATAPAGRFLALFTAAPGEGGGGTELTGAGGYARQALTCSAASSGATENTNSITFGPATGADWGTITHAAVFDTVTGGTMIWYGPLTASKTIAVGDSISFAAGDLDFSLE